MNRLANRIVDEDCYNDLVYLRQNSVEYKGKTKREATAIHLTNIDFNQTKDWKEECQKTEDNLKALLQYSPNCIWIFNREQDYIYINPRAIEITGYDTMDIKNEYEWFQKMDPDHNYRSSIESLNEDTVYKLKCKDETIKYFLLKSGILPDKKQIIYGTDITAKYKEKEERLSKEIQLMEAKERAEKASIKKNEFIANMSHELRTPLNINMGAIQLFESYIKNGNINVEKITKHLNSMKQNSFRLLRLVNHLIDITKIDSGFYKPIFCNQDIVAYVTNILKSVSDYAEQKNIKLIFDSGVSELFMLFDDTMMEQILLNLISNAMKYTKDLIQVSICSSTSAVFITVKDNGIGIEECNQELIFERYTQVSKLLTREHEGSGIGLSLTKSLVELHGGKIKIKSDYGKGSKFIIEFPIHQQCGDKCEFADLARKNLNLPEKTAMALSDIRDIRL